MSIELHPSALNNACAAVAVAVESSIEKEDLQGAGGEDNKRIQVLEVSTVSISLVTYYR